MWITEEAPGFAVWEAVFQGRWLAWGLSFLLVPPPAVAAGARWLVPRASGQAEDWRVLELQVVEQTENQLHRLDSLRLGFGRGPGHWGNHGGEFPHELVALSAQRVETWPSRSSGKVTWRVWLRAEGYWSIWLHLFQKSES